MRKLFQLLSNYKSKKLLLLVIVVALVFAGGYKLGQQNFQASVQNGHISFTHQNPTNQTVDFSLFWDVYASVQQNYYDKTKIDGQKMLYGSIQGMVASLGDPYTVFLTPSQNKVVKNQLGGTYTGVGIELGYKDNHMVVISPLDGSPAKAAGVKAGDLIIKIADKTTDKLTLPDAVNLIRGDAGTSIGMTLLHQGDSTTYDVTLTRSAIKVKSATFSDKGGGVGYIKLSTFGDNTNDEWAAAVDQAKAAGSKVIIVDVRDNPGGYLTDAVNIGSEFIASGAVVKQQTGDTVHELDVVRQGRLLTIPVVVLINGGSASASEILSGALQDYGRAPLVGTQSFGKGTVQEVQDIKCTPAPPDNTCPSLHITVAKWLTPKGRWVHGVGLTPDVKVDITTDDFKAGRDPQLDRAIQIAKSKI